MSRALWCVDCGALASAECEDAHTLWGLRRAVREHAQTIQCLVAGVADDMDAASSHALEKLQHDCSEERVVDALRLTLAGAPICCELSLRCGVGAADGDPSPLRASWVLSEGPADAGHPVVDKMVRLLSLVLLANGRLRRESPCARRAEQQRPLSSLSRARPDCSRVKPDLDADAEMAVEPSVAADAGTLVIRLPPPSPASLSLLSAGMEDDGMVSALVGLKPDEPALAAYAAGHAAAARLSAPAALLSPPPQLNSPPPAALDFHGWPEPADHGLPETPPPSADDEDRSVPSPGQLPAGGGQLPPPSVEPRPELTVDTVDLHDVSSSGCGKKRAEKAEVLQLVAARGVRRLMRLHCNHDPGWSLELLRRAPPLLLQELDIRNASWEHLQTVHLYLPRLRRLRVSGDLSRFPVSGGRRDCKAGGGPELPARPAHLPGACWLAAEDLPRLTLQSLLREHRHDLRELALRVGTGGSVERFPYSGGDLRALLLRCQLASLETLLLERQNCLHVSTRCKAQRSTLLGVLPAGANVLCTACGREPNLKSE